VRGEDRVLGREVHEREVRRVAVVGGEEDVRRLCLRHGRVEEVADEHAAPVVVVARPGGDAVDVGPELGLGEREEGVPRQRETVLDEARDVEPPCGEADGGFGAEVEDGPVRDDVLAGRQPLLLPPR
jgi:hypothetical protein